MPIVYHCDAALAHCTLSPLPHEIRADYIDDSLFVEFIEYLEETLPQMQDFYLRREYGELQAVTHKIAGSAEMFGYGSLGSLSKQIELNCKGGDPEELRETFFDMAARIRNYHRQLDTSTVEPAE